jgi:hypothetical protein
MSKLHICSECKKELLTDQELQNWGICAHCFVYVLRDAMLAMAKEFAPNAATEQDIRDCVLDFIDHQKTLKRISREWIAGGNL